MKADFPALAAPTTNLGTPGGTQGEPKGNPGKLCGARGEIHGYMVMAWREWLEIFHCFFKILTWGCS